MIIRVPSIILFHVFSLFYGIAVQAVPLPAGAYITDILVDPDNPDALHITTSGAGHFYRDGLDAPWEPAHGNPEHRRLYAIAQNPNDRSTVLTGGVDTGPSLGPDGQALTILDISPHPAEADLVYVLTPGGVWKVQGPGGFSERENWSLIFDYAAWLKANRQTDWPEPDWLFSRFQKLTVDPHVPETLLLGARWEGGYHRSDDGGETWSHESLSGVFRRADELRVDPFNPDLYYAFTHHQGLLKSANRGQSWVVAGRGLLPQKRTPHYGVYLLCGISFDPNTPGRILAGSDYSTWLSEDHGESWQEVGRTLTCEFVRATAFHPENPDILYAGSNVGFFQSVDGGVTWEPANAGLPERRVLQEFEAEVGGHVFAFARVAGGNPIYRRPLDRGADAQWRNMSWLLNTGATNLAWDPDGQRLVLTTAEGDILTSSDGGFRWSVPEVIFADLKIQFAPDEVPETAGPGYLVIQNAVIPDPEPLLHWYKRPPFISIQLVGTGYPADGSRPRWQTNWNSRLLGPLEIPASVDTTEGVLIVEVRDFQEGTRTGKAPYRGPDAVTEVVVTAPRVR